MTSLNLEAMKTRHILIIALAATLATACENDPYLYSSADKVYLSGDENQGATDDSTFFSFRLYGDDVTEYTLNVKADLLGKAADHDRQVDVMVVDSLTNVPSSAYEIGDAVIKAGEVSATIPVRVKRSVSGLDLSKQNAKLTLRAVPNSNFEEGVADKLNYSLVWCDYLVRPSSWSIINYYIGNFSQARFKFIIDYTGYTSFEEFENDYPKILSLQALLKRLLEEYNANPANASNPAGWPYLDDDGTPLSF